MNKINWGILSTAKTGVQKVIPAMQAGQHCSAAGLMISLYANNSRSRIFRAFV